MTNGDIRRLLEEATTSRYGALFDLLSSTGLRRGEALTLKSSDVDFTKRLIRVRGTLSRVDGDLVVTPPKTEKSRREIPRSG
jgi:integrase